jgi:hypothetical protein
MYLTVIADCNSQHVGLHAHHMIPESESLTHHSVIVRGFDKYIERLSTVDNPRNIHLV